MSRKPRFEELDDDVDDPREFDLPEFGAGSPKLLPNDFPQPSTGGLPPSVLGTLKPPAISVEEIKHWSCIYPVYFDVTRSIKEGRKVPKIIAVKNPLAKDLAEAATLLGIRSLLEPHKTHPKDWANPGRIRFAFKTESGQRATRFRTKQTLYAAIAEYLKSHPATRESTLKLQLPSLNVDKLPPPPAVPKGRKVNEILPVYSNALSGGGISDNLMRDLMKEEGMAEAAGKSKKPKKK